MEDFEFADPHLHLVTAVYARCSTWIRWLQRGGDFCHPLCCAWFLRMARRPERSREHWGQPRNLKRILAWILFCGWTGDTMLLVQWENLQCSIVQCTLIARCLCEKGTRKNEENVEQNELTSLIRQISLRRKTHLRALLSRKFSNWVRNYVNIRNCTSEGITHTSFNLQPF